MDYKNLRVERDGQVTTVTLDRPKKLNALSLDLMEELEAVAEGFRDDIETRVVVFTGAGKHFTVGADLADPRRAKGLADPMILQQRNFDIGPRMLRRLRNIPQITIAAVNGVALGGGACIVSAMDFHIGASDCKIGYPEVLRGMSLAWVGLPLCVALVGPAKAKRMIIGGKNELAKDLLEWGFLDEVVEPEHLMKRAREMAEEYAKLPPIPAQMIKKSVNAVSGALDNAVMHMDTDQVLYSHTSEDYREGIKSFFEKREPKFEGK